MQVTRDMVIDLLPLYQSGEASADTRAAVEEFLRREPGLGKLLEQGDNVLPPAAATVALEQQTVVRTRETIRRRTWIVALAIWFTLLPFSFAFQGAEITFFMLRDQPGSALCFLAAAGLWLQYARLTRSLRRTGL